ncbi:MAG: adenylate kinase, partial [Flavobacteriaceae bacterium]
MIKLHDKYFKPFLSEAEIQAAVKSIAEKIAEDYKDETPIFVGVLNG